MTARQRLALLLAALLLGAGQACAAAEDLRNVHFGSSSASLTGTGYQRLRAVAAAMKADPSMRLELGGHADASGDSRSNAVLAAERARAARDFLVGLGIDGGRLSVTDFGDRQPLNDNSTLELRAWNRRVQFRRLD